MILIGPKMFSSVPPCDGKQADEAVFFWVFNAATLESFQVLKTSMQLPTAAEASKFLFRLKEPFEGEAPHFLHAESPKPSKWLKDCFKKKGKQGCEEGMKEAKKLLAAEERTTICEWNGAQTSHQRPSCREKTSHLAAFNHHRFIISVPKAATASFSSTHIPGLFIGL